jgi:transcriptional regulator with XRE-family HTH domain
MDTFQNTIGLRIRQLRKTKSLNQAELADLLGMTAANISNIETGANKPSLEAVLRLQEIFDVSADWILNGTNSPYSQSSSNTNTSQVNGGNQRQGHQQVNVGASSSPPANGGLIAEWKEIAQERKLEIMELREQLTRCQELLQAKLNL